MKGPLRTLVTEAVIKRYVGRCDSLAYDQAMMSNLRNGHNRPAKNMTATPIVGNKDFNYTKTSVWCYCRSAPACPAVGTPPPNQHEATYRCSHCLTDTAYQCRLKMHFAM